MKGRANVRKFRVTGIGLMICTLMGCGATSEATVQQGTTPEPTAESTAAAVDDPMGFESEDDSFFEEMSTSQVSQRRSAREILGIRGPEVAWADMSHEDREMDMIGRFLPIMSEVFHEHNAERYAHLDCVSCHGEQMQERNFELPSPDLPAIPEQGTAAYNALSMALPEVMHFMEQEVTPISGTLLGMEDDFSCHSCHPTSGT